MFKAAENITLWQEHGFVIWSLQYGRSWMPDWPAYESDIVPRTIKSIMGNKKIHKKVSEIEIREVKKTVSQHFQGTGVTCKL